MTEDDRATVRRIAIEIMGWSDFATSPNAHRWNPLADLNHAAAMEARIEASGRADAYIDALLQIVNAPHSSRTNLFALATASARQRCMAAIAMIESEKSNVN